MRLFWIQLFEKIDNTTMQEVFFEPEEKLIKNGGKIKYCRVCKRWVSFNDYEDYCQEGYHEFAIEIKPRTIKAYADKLSPRSSS